VALTTGVTQNGYETVNIPPLSVEIKNACFIPSLYHASEGKMLNDV
jgi:hypothetical protein